MLPMILLLTLMLAIVIPGQAAEPSHRHESGASCGGAQADPVSTARKASSSRPPTSRSMRRCSRTF